jgi:hypothetical protein
MEQSSQINGLAMEGGKGSNRPLRQQSHLPFPAHLLTGGAKRWAGKYRIGEKGGALLLGHSFIGPGFK